MKIFKESFCFPQKFSYFIRKLRPPSPKKFQTLCSLAVLGWHFSVFIPGIIGFLVSNLLPKSQEFSAEDFWFPSFSAGKSKTFFRIQQHCPFPLARLWKKNVAHATLMSNHYGWKSICTCGAFIYLWIPYSLYPGDIVYLSAGSSSHCQLRFYTYRCREECHSPIASLIQTKLLSITHSTINGHCQAPVLSLLPSLNERVVALLAFRISISAMWHWTDVPSFIRTNYIYMKSPWGQNK